MLKGYKKSYLFINTVLFMLLTFLLTNFLILKHTSYLFLIISILIPTVLLLAVLGYETRKRRFTYEISFYVFAYCSLFLIITYLLGLVVGFTRSVYKLNLVNLTHNIIPYFLLIFISEILRFQVVKKGSGSKLSYVLITMVLIVVDYTLFMDNYNLGNGDDVIKFICCICMPSFFKNIVLLYFTKNGGIHSSLIYRLIMDLKIVLLPIFPDFKLYFEAIINTILPILVGFMIYLNLLQFKNKEVVMKDVKFYSFFKYLAIFVLVGFTILANVASNGDLKYSIVSIGSGSMVPSLNKGDAVIYEKICDDNIPEVGDILVFRKEKKIIVHRIIEIIEIDGNDKVYYTQGDANEKPDGYPITKDDIIGVVKYKLKYIGIPSVVLGEMVN